MGSKEAEGAGQRLASAMDSVADWDSAVSSFDRRNDV